MQISFDLLQASDPDVYAALQGEEQRQRDGIELIPSENYAFPEVYATNGSVFANKYSEGYPGRRYYGGQQFTDRIETLAVERAKALFRAEHANVQPLSGSPMNQAVYMACLEPGDTVLAMDLSHGGHLTHGAPVSCMGKIFNFVRYRTLPPRGDIDYDGRARDGEASETEDRAVRTLVLSARVRLRALPARSPTTSARSTMADVSHVGGLIAGGALANPLDAGFDIVTTTTHKSLRGPRGGMILCKSKLAQKIDQAVFPGMQGGPHMNAVAGIAVTLKLAAQPAFRVYAKQVLANAQALAKELQQRGCTLITGGTENHLMVIDTIKSFGIDGRVAEKALDDAGLTVNKQVIPDDPRPAAAPERHPPRHAGVDDARHEGVGDVAGRAVDGRSDAALTPARRSSKSCAQLCRRCVVGSRCRGCKRRVRAAGRRRRP